MSANTDNHVSALRANFTTLTQVAAAHPDVFQSKPRTWNAAAAALAAFADAAQTEPTDTAESVRAAASKLRVVLPLKGGKIPRTLIGTVGAVIGRIVEHDAPNAIVDADGFCPRHGGSKATPKGPAAAIKSAINAGGAMSALSTDPRKDLVAGIVDTLTVWGVPPAVLAAAITAAADRVRDDLSGSRCNSRAGRKAAAARKRVRVSLDRVEDRTADAAQAVAGAMDAGADREAIADREARGVIRGKARAGHVKVRKAAKAADAAAGTAEKATRRANAAAAAAAQKRAAVAAARAALKS